MASKIFCIGDSITFGIGESPCVGWVGRLKKDIELIPTNTFVYNLGIPGDTSDDILKRIVSDVKPRSRILDSSDRSVLILSVGTNDLKLEVNNSVVVERVTESIYRDNMVMLIKKINELKIDRFYLINLPPVDEARTKPFRRFHILNSRITQFNKVLIDISKEHNLKLIDIHSKFAKSIPELLEDGLHPNGKGYDLMYKIISNVLIKDGLL